jgi:hypothetical protein
LAGAFTPNKEKEMSHANLSRRAVLVGATALPVTVLPIAELDSELLALGAKLEPIIQEWLAQSAIDAQVISVSGDMTEQECEAASRVWTHIHERMDPLIEDILSCKSQTVAGLAVQARAMTLNHYTLWDGGDPFIVDPEQVRPFLDKVCAFVGIKPVPTELVTS